LNPSNPLLRETFMSQHLQYHLMLYFIKRPLKIQF
jgi:hypothetical protein